MTKTALYFRDDCNHRPRCRQAGAPCEETQDAHYFAALAAVEKIAAEAAANIAAAAAEAAENEARRAKDEKAKTEKETAKLAARTAKENRRRANAGRATNRENTVGQPDGPEQQNEPPARLSLVKDAPSPTTETAATDPHNPTTEAAPARSTSLVARTRNRRARRDFATSMTDTARELSVSDVTRARSPYATRPPKRYLRLLGTLPDGRARAAAWLGLYSANPVPLTTTTTAAGILSPFTTEPDLGYDGILRGFDPITRTPFILDNFKEYGGLVKIGNEIVYGDTNFGKTTYLKTTAQRAVRHGYHVFSIGTKPQTVPTSDGGEISVDEWTPGVRALGYPVMRIDPDGGTIINPLDRRIVRRAVGNNTFGQESLLVTLIEGGGNLELEASQIAAVSTALRRAQIQCDQQRIIDRKANDAAMTYNAAALIANEGMPLATAFYTERGRVLPKQRADIERRDPELWDVQRLLMTPLDEDAAAIPTKPESLRAWGEVPGLILRNVLNNELRGIADGQTDMSIDFDAQWIHADLAALQQGSKAIGLVMSIVGTVVRNVWLARRPGTNGKKRRHIFIVDESWHILALPSVARLFKSLWKYWRALGLINIVATHRPSDVPLNSDAQSIVDESGIVTSFHLKMEHAERVRDLHSLTNAETRNITTLAQGTYMSKIGDMSARYCYIPRSEFEELSTNSDYAMLDGTASLTYDTTAPNELDYEDYTLDEDDERQAS